MIVAVNVSLPYNDTIIYLYDTSMYHERAVKNDYYICKCTSLSYLNDLANNVLSIWF